MLDIQYQLPTLPRLVTGDGDGAGKHHFEANLIDREAVNCFPILLSVAATAAAVAAGTLAVRDSYGISRLDILMVIRDLFMSGNLHFTKKDSICPDKISEHFRSDFNALAYLYLLLK